jgi:hypothetical protein
MSLWDLKTLYSFPESIIIGTFADNGVEGYYSRLRAGTGLAVMKRCRLGVRVGVTLADKSLDGGGSKNELK